MPAPYAKNGNVAVITLDNPAVNGLGHALRSGSSRALMPPRTIPKSPPSS